MTATPKSPAAEAGHAAIVADKFLKLVKIGTDWLIHCKTVFVLKPTD